MYYPTIRCTLVPTLVYFILYSIPNYIDTALRYNDFPAEHGSYVLAAKSEDSYDQDDSLETVVSNLASLPHT